MTEHERKRLCRILNCHRLSLDACTHASQNERLPLRFVVQVLFCEQLKIRSTVTEVSNSVKEDRANADNVSVASREPTGADSQPTASTSAELQENVNQMEIRALQRELATMRVKCIDLERDHSTIQDRVLFSTLLCFLLSSNCDVIIHIKTFELECNCVLTRGHDHCRLSKYQECPEDAPPHGLLERGRKSANYNYLTSKTIKTEVIPFELTSRGLAIPGGGETPYPSCQKP